MKEKEFTGIWIPKHIVEDKDLSIIEKWVYAEISCFDIFFQLNSTLAETLNVDIKTVTRAISRLKDKGYVVQIGFDGRKRTLKALRDLPRQNVQADGTNCPGRWDKMSHIDNNIENKEKKKIYKRKDKAIKDTNTNNSPNGQLATPQRVENVREEGGVSYDDINEVFKSFDQIKDSAGEGKYTSGNKTKNWWGDKTKHYNSKLNYKQAAAELIKKYGKEEVIEKVGWVDLRGYPINDYLPYTVTVNNPVELLEKWDKIIKMVEDGSEAYYKKHPDERPDFSFLN